MIANLKKLKEEFKMALTDESGSGLVMPVAPMYGGGGGNGGFGNMGGDWGWIILLLLIAGNGWGGVIEQICYLNMKPVCYISDSLGFRHLLSVAPV